MDLWGENAWPTFYNAETGFMDQGKALYVVYLDFSKAFNTISRNILIDNLKKYDLDKWIVKLTENEFKGWAQMAVNNGKKSSWRQVTSGTPQESIWVLILFNSFINELGTGAKCPLRKFAYNTELVGISGTWQTREVC